jgi:hypothetical protein
MNCIGLFGTCDKSNWRDRFIHAYDKLGIEYFNPVKEDWTPADAVNEAKHMASDKIILLAVTYDEYSIASLAEIGFAVMNAVLEDRYAVIYLAPKLSKQLAEKDENLARIINNGRAIVGAHLKKLDRPNVYVVSSLDEALETSIRLHNFVHNLSRKV